MATMLLLPLVASVASTAAASSASATPPHQLHTFATTTNRAAAAAAFLPPEPPRPPVAPHSASAVTSKARRRERPGTTTMPSTGGTGTDRGGGSRQEEGGGDATADVAAHQDPTELFDLYHSPPQPNIVVSRPPTKTGSTKQRSAVHRDGDWHRSMHVWLLDDCTSSGQGLGNVLLQRRSSEKDTHPGLLDVSCAGHVTSGDDLDETAVRELEEELGLRHVYTMDDVRRGRAFTVAAEVEGTAGRHGRFICREFQEVYVLRWSEGGSSKLPFVPSSFVPDSAEEVAGFEVAPMDDVLRRLRAGGEELVPRSAAYVDALEEALRES